MPDNIGNDSGNLPEVVLVDKVGIRIGMSTENVLKFARKKKIEIIKVGDQKFLNRQLFENALIEDSKKSGTEVVRMHEDGRELTKLQRDKLALVARFSCEEIQAFIDKTNKPKRTRGGEPKAPKPPKANQIGHISVGVPEPGNFDSFPSPEALQKWSLNKQGET
jgi:hypothetical protein